jgi:hypothetical protein
MGAQELFFPGSKMSSFTSCGRARIFGRLSYRTGGYLEAVQSLPVQAVAGTRTLDLPLDKSGSLEHFQMLAHGGLGQRQNLDDLATNAPIDGLEVLNDPDPGRVPQGFAYSGKGSGIQYCFSALIHGFVRFDNKAGAG